MVVEGLGRKILTYVVNYAARPISNSIKDGFNLGNPWTAIGLAAVDIATKQNSLVNRTVKLGVGIGFLIPTISNLVDIANGDYTKLLDLPFNASITYSGLRDVKNACQAEDTNIVKDILNTTKGDVAGSWI